MKLLFAYAFVVTFSLANCYGINFKSIPTIEIGEESCCSLKWMQIPPNKTVHGSALNFTSGQGVQYYFVKNESDTLGFVREKNTSYDYILANPHNCSLEWINHTASSYRKKQPHLYLPVVDSLVISISSENHYYNWDYFRRNVPGTRFKVAEFADIFQMSSAQNSIRTPSGCEGLCDIRERMLLFVNCMKSMQNVLTPELRSIEINSTSLLTNSGLTEVKSVQVTNKNDHDIVHWFGVNEPVLIRFSLELDNYRAPFSDYVKNETNLASFKQRNWHSVLGKIYQSEKADDFLPKIRSTGRFSTEPSTSSNAIFDKEVIIPAQSKCKVSGLVTSFHAVNERVNVIFEIVPLEGFKQYWTSKQIISSLQASGVETSQLVEENGKLIVRYPGGLNVDSFTSEIVEVKCEKTE